MQGLPFVRRAVTTGVFESTALWGEPLCSHHVFQFVPIKLSKAPLLGDLDLLVARELELGPV